MGEASFTLKVLWQEIRHMVISIYLIIIVARSFGGSLMEEDGVRVFRA